MDFLKSLVQWGYDVITFLFSSNESLNTSFLPIAFTMNTWALGLSRQRRAICFNTRRLISQTIGKCDSLVSRYADAGKNLTSIESVEAMEEWLSAYEKIVKKVQGWHNKVETFLTTTEVIAKYVMIVCSVVALSFIVIPYRAPILVLLLLPYPGFMLLCKVRGFLAQKSLERLCKQAEKVDPRGSQGSTIDERRKSINERVASVKKSVKSLRRPK